VDSVVFGVDVSCVCVFWSGLSYKFFSCMPLKPLSLLFSYSLTLGYLADADRIAAQFPGAFPVPDRHNF
jgi:hypothetical protein